VLPVGLLQTWASVQHGYWYARSAEFLGAGWMQTLRWMRVPGDTLFAIGAIVLVIFSSPAIASHASRARALRRSFAASRQKRPSHAADHHATQLGTPPLSNWMPPSVPIQRQPMKTAPAIRTVAAVRRRMLAAGGDDDAGYRRGRSAVPARKTP
jgi:hypothetical protein